VQKLGSEVVFESPWMRVREDLIELPDGEVHRYGIVERADFVVVIPFERGMVCLVEQYRPSVDRRVWEFPQGAWDPGDSGTSSDLARLELAEETGFRAEEWTHLGRAFSAYGFCTQSFDVYLAKKLSAGPTRRSPGEQSMEQRMIPLTEFRYMVLSGEIMDAATIAAFTFANWSGNAFEELV
jgi:8-oxo-dGTP pyrophosphatase MutT (NUDIX family)